MDNESENQLVGRCPICPAPSPDENASDAYVASTIVDSDKDMYLVWSVYYELYVCKLCEKEGRDLGSDPIRDQEDVDRESRRYRMGFKNTYVTN